MIVKSKYIAYKDIDLNTFSKEKKERISLTLSVYLACKLEQFALKKGINISDLVKTILIENNVLNKRDISFSNKKKHTSKFDNIDCESLKDIKSYKTYNIFISEYAKMKIYNYLAKKDINDFSFFIITKLTKNLGKYEIFTLKDIGF